MKLKYINFTSISILNQTVKLDTVETYNWPSGFSDLLDELQSNVDADFFSSENIQDSKSYLDNWLEEVFDIQGIDTIMVAHSFATFWTANELEELEISQAQPTNDCDCKWNLVCYMFAEGFCEEDMNDCDHTNSGCGLLWMYSCNGLCSEGVLNPQ